MSEDIPNSVPNAGGRWQSNDGAQLNLTAAVAQSETGWSLTGDMDGNVLSGWTLGYAIGVSVFNMADLSAMSLTGIFDPATGSMTVDLIEQANGTPNPPAKATNVTFTRQKPSE